MYSYFNQLGEREREQVERGEGFKNIEEKNLIIALS